MKTSALCLVLCFLFASSAFALDKNKDCKCRITSAKRIVGGRPSHLAYPWHVTIRRNDQSNRKPDYVKRLLPEQYKLDLHTCSGVLLNEEYVLSTANCLFNGGRGLSDPQLYAVEFGSNDLVQAYNQDKYVEAKKVIFHPKYETVWPRVWNDIGLIKLKTPLNFSDSIVQPACLGTAHQESYEGILRTIGFGSKVPTIADLDQDPFLSRPQYSRYLKEANVFENTNSSDYCKDKAKENICVKPANKTDNAQGTPCTGDEGAPLHVQTNGKSTVVGIFSNYEPVEETNIKGSFCEAGSSFTRISYYYDWIRSEVVGEMCD